MIPFNGISHEVLSLRFPLVGAGMTFGLTEADLNLQVIIFQTYWRRWLAKKYVQKLREDCIRRQEWERQEELRKQKERAERIRKEWERRMNQKTKEDFDLLYAYLESKFMLRYFVFQ